MRALAVLAMLAAGAGAALAGDAGTKDEQAACRSDVRRFCGRIGKGDEQKYRDCLQARFQDLSQKCQQVLMKHQNQP